MLHKRAFYWNNALKVKGKLPSKKKVKGKPFKRRPSGLNISVSRLDVPLTPFMPVFPHQDRCNRIKNSVARHTPHEHDPSVVMYYNITPVMIFRAEKECSYHLVYGDCGLPLTAEPYKLIFPDEQILELTTDIRTRQNIALIQEDAIALVALYCETNQPFQAIEFGENVKMNQLVYLFDFRYAKPSVTEGTVAYADSSHFIFDARPNDQYIYGALVFDVNDKLVGLVYSHAGSLKAIQVDHLKPMLAEILLESRVMPWSLGRDPSLRDFPSPSQPHDGEEEAALCQDSQARTMDAAADTTLDFTKQKLDGVYEKISPFIVSVRLESGPDAIGFIIRQTPEHHKIAVQTCAMTSEVKSVKFANKNVYPIHKVQIIDPVITILYVKRRGGDPLLGKFDHADPTDNVCEKVVTFFPYMDGVAMFKGHIISTEEEIPAIDFMFTCPYATTYEFTGRYVKKEELSNTFFMTVGAPIFSLEGGVFLGILTRSGDEYDVKLAMNSSNFYNRLPEEIMGKKSNSKDEMEDKHEEEKGTKGAKGKKSNSKDETKHRKDKHGEEDGMKGAKKGKKSNSKDGRKHKKNKHEELDGQSSVGSDIAHCLLARHDDTPMIDKETHRLAVVNMDKSGKDCVEDKPPEFDLSKDERFKDMFTSHLYALDPTDPRYKRTATFMRKQAGKKGAGTSDC